MSKLRQKILPEREADGEKGKVRMWVRFSHRQSQTHYFKKDRGNHVFWQFITCFANNMGFRWI